ncbi:MAG: hypothetical protein HXX80_03905 [Nitrososphaerales archaeon]|nr:hypothetical protein [Nitrososphaerales archaeon]
MSIDSIFPMGRDDLTNGVVSQSVPKGRALIHGRILPQLEVPPKRHTIKPHTVPNRKEGLNSLYKAGAMLWLLLCHRYPSLRAGNTYRLINEAMRRYRYRLYNLSDDPECLDYSSLIDRRYVKEKHWTYAAYIATITSLPLLYKVCDSQKILMAILTKTSFGANAKLLDNLNDEVHDTSQAVDALKNWLSAHTRGEYDNQKRDRDPIIARAENSAFKMGTWVFRAVNSCRLHTSQMYGAYLNDVIKIVDGQINSIKHKADRKGRLPSLREYIGRISEKSIGDLWIDIDLCFLEEGIEGFDGCQERAIESLKFGNSLIFKSCLFYDDVQDIYEDLSTKSINSSIILALERGVISYNDLEEKSAQEMVKKLRETGILMDTIRLADLFFITGIETLYEAKDSLKGFLDLEGLIRSYRLLRMFLMRKILNMNRDYESLKLFFSSLGDLDKIKRAIPDDIMGLKRYIMK